MASIFVGKQVYFYGEDTAYSGVKKIAEKVKQDIQLVTEHMPTDWDGKSSAENLVLYGTVGKSAVLEELEQKGLLDLSAVRGKWEVYGFQILEHPLDGVNHALVIAGSDKRGTIYGLFHLSELMGVSPLVNWNHVWPAKKSEVVLTDAENQISREPSVKYRGFFINDEWPAFGTWATVHFGGVNAKCYEAIFDLLLRLKGNYLWPAMWATNFNMDGPGLLSAELADEYGVVMSMSHHEPCNRSGEEYTLLRGKDSIYGDAWDFNANEEGITRFWRDGLLRNRSFENVITMGMRGERDTAIMKDASLEENIDLLRRVLKTQNQLIRETVNEDLSRVPRQIVFFTEVESFFYGTDQVKGLKGDPELEGVTLMLTDNNHGAMRTLPTKDMRDHKGGYGMYYHMDMHGGAHSFEWIGPTYLPKVWEQMTMAYEYGVREIWISNVGDVGTQEFGLSYFLDLAYDIDKWGGEDASVTEVYTREWLKQQFGSIFEEEDLKKAEQIFWDYTTLLARRKHEVMNDKVYHPIHFGEAKEAEEISDRILMLAEELKAKCPKERLASFISLLYYPACGTANLMKMWILAGRNRFYAEQNRVEANLLADALPDYFQRDRELVQEYMSVDQGYFDGFGLSEHIGFTTWCDEDNKYPLRTYVYPANKPRMLVARSVDEHYLTGDEWRDRPQTWKDALRPDVKEIEFEIARASRDPIHYRITSDCPWMQFSSREGVVETSEKILLSIDRSQLRGKAVGYFTVENRSNPKKPTAEIYVEVYEPEEVHAGPCFYESDGYISMEAVHFQRAEALENGAFHKLIPCGRTGSAIKVFPVTASFEDTEQRPFVEYHFEASVEGTYEVLFYMEATTPVEFRSRQYIGYSVNEGEVQIVNTVEEEDKMFFLSPQWSREAFENVRKTTGTVFCRKGRNTLRFYAVSPAIVLEKIVLRREETVIPDSYLGPKESYCWKES